MFNTVMRCIGFFVFGPLVLVGLRILIAWQCRQEKGLDWKAELQRRMSKAQTQGWVSMLNREALLVNIPAEIRDYKTYVIAYSGGKDSTATLLWALDNLPRDRLRVIFCDTGAEWPETYEYLKYIEQQLDVVIERVSNGDRPLPPDSSEFRIWSSAPTLLEMIRQRGKWPSGQIRYCTKYLKMYPLRSQYTPNSVLLFGERAQESRHRALLEQYQDSAGQFHKAPVYRPILAWSERDVWEYLRAHRVLPNPIYNHATRCGCWCCIMAPKTQVLNFCKLHPEIAQEAADLEREIGHTWKENQSIGNLLAQARAQPDLFDAPLRFEDPLVQEGDDVKS